MTGSRLLKTLTPERARIFRLTHRDNMPFILRHGVCCANASLLDPAFITIGMANLITKRAQQPLPRPYQGVLSDYVPFYFTPRSIMAYRIRTGIEVAQKPNNELVHVVASLPKLKQRGIRFLFTDHHASSVTARFFDRLEDLHHVDWPLLQSGNFERDQENDPSKLLRYQAEALVRTCLPLDAIDGIICFDTETHERIGSAAAAAGKVIDVAVRPGLYFQ